MIEKIDLTGKTRDEWIALRKRDVTASRVGALFGLDPYCSALRLYHEKAGVLELPDQPDSGVMRRGRLFEGAVAAAVAEERPQWTITKASVYLRDPELRLGATPDFFVEGDPRGLGVLQCKTVAPSVFAREWKGASECPFGTALQVITEGMLCDAAFNVIAALSIDAFNVECKIVEVARHPAAEQRIRDAVRQFWQEIENGQEPAADYGLDRDVIAALLPQETPGRTIDLSGDNEAIDGLIERGDLKERMKRDEARCKEIEAQLMHKMGDAERIVGVPDFNVTWKVQQRAGYEVKPRSSRVLIIRDHRPDAEEKAA